MTNSLAIREKEDVQPVAQPLADLPTYVDACVDMDGDVLGEFVERNWNQVIGNSLGLMYLVKEMKRKFKGLDRKKQVDGTYKKIRGYTSFDAWFTNCSGKSRRLAYYLLETEEKKNERNAERRTSEKKKDKVKSLYREGEVIEHDGRQYVVTNVAIHEDTDEKSSFIVEVEMYDDENETVPTTPKKEEDPQAVEAQKAKRSAAAKKAAATSGTSGTTVCTSCP